MTDKPIIKKSFNDGMSQDEYGGEGTFLYGENVAVDEQNGISLSEYIEETNINQRGGGQSSALLITGVTRPTSFSADGYIEITSGWLQLSYKDLGYYGSGYGPIYKAPTGYYNAIQWGNVVAAIREDKIDRFTLASGETRGILGNNVVANPGLTSDVSWTVGAGRATGVNGAIHASGGGNNSLLQSITTNGTGEIRVNILVDTWTTGSLQLKYNGSNLGSSFTATSNQLYVTIMGTGTGGAANFEIIPSNLFNGTVKFVDVRELDTDTKIGEVTLTPSTIHPVLYDGLLYVGSGNVLEVVDTTLAVWAVTQTLQLNTDDVVTGITKIGTSYMIYTNNGQNGRQYFRDGVSTSWTEEIFWRDLPIINVQNDGNQDYLVCGSQDKSSLWLVSGYTKNMIAQSNYIADGGREISEYYKVVNKFLFYNPYPGAMEMYRKRLFCPGYSGRNYWVGSKYTVQGIPIVMNYRSIQTVYSSATIGDTLCLGYKQKLAVGGVTYNTIGYLNFSQSHRSGHLITNPILRDTASSIKQLKKLNIGYRGELGHTINVYAQIDDKRYTTFAVSSVTISPTVGAIYGSGGGQQREVISTNIVAGAGTITTKFIGTKQTSVGNSMSLSKVSGTGDAAIGASDSNNYILINSYSPTTYEYGRIALFGPAFVNLTDFHKISFKIELISDSVLHTPIVFDIPYMANIVKDLTYN